MTSEVKKISFTKEKEDGDDFISVLRKRVNLYFKERGVSSKANASMYLKSIFLMSLVALTYGTLVANVVGGLGVLALYMLLGLIASFGAMNIAHDALHGAYASRAPGNRVLGLIMDLVGASSFYWKKEHTIDHHTYTNIAEYDTDLNVPILLRVCPKAERRSFHRFQHWYAIFLYSLNFIHWVYSSDVKRIYRILTKKHPGSPPKGEIFFLFSFKIIHILLFLAIPIMCLSVPWWQVVLAYGAFLSTIGVTVTTIFQLAHIVENVAFPLPNAEGKIENSFAKHQLSTTSNFAVGNRLVRFLFGGLNFQIEHHIFPHICHAHLHKISPIVKATAKEFDLPYHENPSFIGALRSHFRTLKRFGRES